MKQHSYLFFLVIFITFTGFITCKQEQYQPQGLWEEIGDSNNKIIVQQYNAHQIAYRLKDQVKWHIFNKENEQLFIGEELRDLALIAQDTLEIYSKEMRDFKNVYQRIPSHMDDFWLLNLLMPKKTVQDLLGYPDSVSMEYDLEEWFYGQNKVIRFGKKGVYDFSTNNKIQPNIQLIEVGQHFKEVIELIGSPYHSEEKTSYLNQKIHTLYYYGKQSKITLKDSIVENVILNVNRHNKEWDKLVKATPLMLQFSVLPPNKHALVVEEKGKIVDSLQIKYLHSVNQFGNLRLIGKRYHIFIRIYTDNTFQAMYSRSIPQKGQIDIQSVHRDMDIIFNYNHKNPNQLAGKLQLIIHEPHAKNTKISGYFLVDIPKTND